jgi:hypothetical protein
MLGIGDVDWCFGAESEQHGKRTRSGADRMRMIRRQMEERSRGESLPASAKKKIAGPIQNLDQCSTTVGVRSQLLALGEREEHDPRFRALQDGPAHNAGRGKLGGFDQGNGLRIIDGKQGDGTHAPTLHASGPMRLDAGQVRRNWGGLRWIFCATGAHEHLLLGT